MSYILLCTIPVLLIIHIFYLQAKSDIEEASHNFSTLFAEQLEHSITMYLSSMDNTSKALFTDYELIYYLGQENRYSTIDKINYNLEVNTRLAHFYTQMPYLQGIMIIASSGKTYSHGISPEHLTLPYLNEQEWYRSIIESRGQLIVTPAHSLTYSSSSTPQNMFSVGRLLTDPEGRKAGVILFHLAPNTLVYSDDYMNEISETYHTRVLLMTNDNRYIFDSDSTATLIEQEADGPDQSRYFIHRSEAYPNGMIITVAVSKEVLYESIKSYRNLALIVAGVTLLVILVIAAMLSMQIMKPIKHLIHGMRHVENGYYLPIEEAGNSMEFQRLTSTYNLMIAKIKHLIEDVYKAKIKQDEARFLALQSQINPHWLYNTLESIRMKAQLSGNPEVAAMIKTLGRLFHMALTKKPRPNCIKDELDYAQAYLELQNIRYKNRFRLTVDIPESLIHTPVIRLLFQPIIENSIIHGFIEHDRLYHIRISSRTEEGVLHLVIADDGAGMSASRLEWLNARLASVVMQEHSSQSIGLLNIQERIVLTYGRAYGIVVRSSEHERTEVVLSLPIEE
ncbi:histidine kinase [Paenibacillus sp. J5C_2022]|nr:histidine kinase [Paenibacillus sp. J5C2022]